ncbi:transglycosylase domain-containing protein [Fervidobacterium gondwanense]|uniref:Membrane carboxypeptidase (Penicillin-binding protein) n=1 Tax=Fervidobacterium gondwanense DSM 13020 TaxID=1121883 RepID=A0A1M7SJ26_FERGO|nr:transglycosylase domain-containing protein [Fervidobacterium gondwanense]SHN58485.1 Membrane carboxypeptidase (penicillin-binding protein) [Fervidobacterium gondwanense DSM 13020]
MKKFLLILFLLFFTLSFIFPMMLYKWYTSRIEPPQNKVPASLVVEYSDGTPLYTPKTVWIDFEDIPNLVKDSIVASEDKRFYQHSGVDLIGIARSFFVILTTDSIQGGSTITQQLARTLYLTTERTWKRKIKEALIALWLEQNYSKNEILELYINFVYLGNGVYGFPAAAKYYFNKTLEQLKPVEVAMLTATLRSPEHANPLEELNADFTKTVLRKMMNEGVITNAEYENALETLSSEHARNVNIAGNMFDQDLFWMVVVELKELGFELGDLRNGFRVRTTIDKNMQTLLNKNIDKTKMAGLIIEHTTGRIRAAYGLGITSGRRQVGSVIKPMYYYLAFMGGWNKNDILEDKPITIGTWSPQNFDKEFWQEVTLENALIYSRNVPSVNLFMALGQSKVKNFLKNTLMVDGYYPNDATLALGTLETSLVDVAKGFEPIFNGGIVIRPRIIEYVKDRNGVIYYSYKPEILNVVKPPKDFEARTPVEASVLTMQLMEKVVTMGTGKSANIPGRKIYGKTGTAEKNAWFVGGDGKYLFLLVKDGKDLTGGRDVAPVWREIAKNTEIGYIPISLPVSKKMPSTEKKQVEEETVLQPLSPVDEESISIPDESISQTTEKADTEEDIFNRVRSKSITSDELLNVLKTMDSDKQREVLSRINEIDPDLASQVYTKLLGGGEF